MIKNWLSMWQNAFDYKGKVTRKEYWSACITNYFATLIFAVLFALILRNFPISPIAATVVILVLFHIPVVALYFRRANDANWKKLTTLYVALVCPVISGLIVGALPSVPKEAVFSRFYSVICKLFALSFGLFFYGGVLGILLFGDPTSIMWLSCSELFLGAGILIYYGVRVILQIISLFR